MTFCTAHKLVLATFASLWVMGVNIFVGGPVGGDGMWG